MENHSAAVRPLVEDDKARILDLLRRTGFFTDDEVAVAEELIDAWLYKPEQKDYRVYATGRPGEPEGYVCFGPTPATEGTYDLYWIAVDPRLQGRGIGRRLLAFTEEEVRSEGGKLIIIETSSTERYGSTQNFYLKAGYAVEARIKDFYRRATTGSSSPSGASPERRRDRLHHDREGPNTAPRTSVRPCPTSTSSSTSSARRSPAPPLEGRRRRLAHAALPRRGAGRGYPRFRRLYTHVPGPRPRDSAFAVRENRAPHPYQHRPVQGALPPSRDLRTNRGRARRRLDGRVRGRHRRHGYPARLYQDRGQSRPLDRSARDPHPGGGADLACVRRPVGRLPTVLAAHVVRGRVGSDLCLTKQPRGDRIECHRACPPWCELADESSGDAGACAAGSVACVRLEHRAEARRSAGGREGLARSWESPAGWTTLSDTVNREPSLGS
ncbi:MAG: GNAT family N-acetyltransferase, partial [Candidatus Competibacteraceae bacterium]|nr:GNAT family N-acetyltransferase [Candidatus Competibacteraceae bacterium]